MTEVLIFDFDGLIFDTEKYDLEAFQMLYQKYNVAFPTDEWMLSVGSSLTFDPYEKLLLESPYLNREDIRVERRNLYLESLENETPREGVLEYIKRARELNMKVALASSSTRSWIDFHLEKIKLNNTFDFICTADDVEHVKPEPDLYHKVLNHFNLSPDQALVLEDSPNGALASIRADITCVVVPNEITAALDFDSRILLRLNSKKDMTLDEVLSVARQKK